MLVMISPYNNASEKLIVENKKTFKFLNEDYKPSMLWKIDIFIRDTPTRFHLRYEEDDRYYLALKKKSEGKYNFEMKYSRSAYIGDDDNR